VSSAQENKPNADMRSFQGRTLCGSYLLGEYLSEGNFGAVYRSEQQFLGRTARRVAVKLSKHTDITTETARDIFADAFLLAEALDEMTDALARSYLVHVYDVGLVPELDSRAFVVMEFVQGTTLKTQFDSYKMGGAHGRVPANLLLKWTRQICHALKELHSLAPPVLHRDLKPDNILLGVDNNVRVVDFGLSAKLLSSGIVPGVAGTIAYMSPETSQGESVPASDVYSIGLILYEGLTGRLPFDHIIVPPDLPKAFHSDWLYKQKSNIRPTPVSFMNNTVSPELNAAVMRCLAFNPRDRFFNASELLESLEPKPASDSPDVEALNEGRRLRATDDLDAARRAFERGLTTRSSSQEIRFLLLRGLGELLAAAGDHRTAAARLVEAWELVKNTAILRTRRERAELLKQIEDAYRASGNPYQADRYKTLAEQEVTRR